VVVRATIDTDRRGVAVPKGVLARHQKQSCLATGQGETSSTRGRRSPGKKRGLPQVFHSNIRLRPRFSQQKGSHH